MRHVESQFPRLGMEPVPPAVELWSPNYWTAREVPRLLTSCCSQRGWEGQPPQALLLGPHPPSTVSLLPRQLTPLPRHWAFCSRAPGNRSDSQSLRRSLNGLPPTLVATVQAAVDQERVDKLEEKVRGLREGGKWPTC